MFESLDLTRLLQRLPAPALASAQAARARAEALDLLERESPAAPAFGYAIHPAHKLSDDTLRVAEAELTVPALAGQNGELAAVAAVACSLGASIQHRVSELFALRRPALALALDTLASELLFRVADRAVAAVRRDAHRMGLSVGGEASPGDPAFALEHQAAVLALADAGANSVATLHDGMLTPVHSLCTLVSLGRNLPRHSASTRCSRCPSADRCTIRAN